MRLSVRFIAAVLSVLASVLADAQGMPTLHIGDKYYALDEAQIVAKESVIQAQWAAWGDYVVGTRSTDRLGLADQLFGNSKLEGKLSVFVYEWKTGRYSELYSRSSDGTEMLLCDPIWNSPYALIHSIDRDENFDEIVGIADLKANRIREWKGGRIATGLNLHVSKEGDALYCSPYAKATDPKANSTRISIDRYSMDGVRVATAVFEVPGTSAFLYQEDDGNVTIRFVQGKKLLAGIPNFKTGKIDGVTVKKPSVADQQKSFYVQELPPEEQGTTGMTGAIFLAKVPEQQEAAGKTNPVLLISTNGSGAVVSPRDDAVLYLYDRAAIIKPIVEIPKDLYERAMAEAARMQALMKAKQVGLAILMYGSDNDNNAPGRDVDIYSLLEPYAKNPGLLSGFVYTFQGGNLADLRNPAGTELGHVDGPGGRAVVYADGHAKWIADK